MKTTHPTKLPYEYGFHMDETAVYKPKKGLDETLVKTVSAIKHEPLWMREFRIESFHAYQKFSLPGWGSDLSGIDFSDMYYYLRPIDRQAKTWKDLPKEILDTYEKIGMPKMEREYLAGVSAQYESEVVYKSVVDTLSKKGVIFLSMDEGLLRYPDLVKEYFGKIVPPRDNMFAALNSCVWSGGTFLYVPKGVKVDLPLQAYFRINAANMGQFERTLIIADEGSSVYYTEGCTAPIYSTDSLHSAVVEIVVKKGARVRYTTVQNWSTNVYNLVTKRALVGEEGVMEWVDGNLGSKVTMKYPSVYLVGRKAKGDILSIAFAGSGQILDAGAKAMHRAPETSSRIISKSVCVGGGRTSYRGRVYVSKGAIGAKSDVVCDALILDPISRSDTYPSMEILERQSRVTHEASVSKIEADQLFYLQSRGIGESSAKSLIVNGFIEPVAGQLPLEYAVELNRLIGLRMEGSVG